MQPVLLIARHPPLADSEREIGLVQGRVFT